MEATRIAVIGSGNVGRALGSGLIRHGHEVVLGSRDLEQEHVRHWLADAGEKGRALSQPEAARWAEWVFLCVPGRAVEETVRGIGAGNLAGKLVVDVTNVVGRRDDGSMTLLWGIDDSAAWRVQREAPEARVVKAFNTVGNTQMIDPKLVDGPPTMPICGNDAASKEAVSALLRDVGWEPTDLGGLESAPLIEAMGLVWMQFAHSKGDWRHAFRLLPPA